jgi:ubiquinone/menaquinone biosynthesis C-methylase UbiE
MSELSYKDEAASAYDRAFAHVSTHFLPFLLRAARLEPGQRVLDAATGTGIAAEAALAVVGSGGHVTAADISQAMVDRARQRLADLPNTSIVVEDGQSLSFDDGTFDAVLCSLGLMFFRDPARGLSEFNRVLRPGGRAAVSVSTPPERSYNGRINVIIARRVPSLAEAVARTFSLGDAARLRSLFEGAGFRDVETTTEAHRFVLPSFEAYFQPFEQGGGSSGQAYLVLPEEERRAVREEVRRNVGDTGGPIGIEVEERFASGRRG